MRPKRSPCLKHPHVVQVYEFGSHEGKPFFSLEYLEGGSLADKLRGEPQPPARQRRRSRPGPGGAGGPRAGDRASRPEAGQRAPGRRRRTPKITDFGVAKQGDSVMTATGDVLGTPSYMAPEQAEGKTKLVGPAVDIYALGAILYELLTGRPPFKGASAWETIQLVTHSEAVAPCQLQPRVPRDLETICLKCLDKEPSRRYATAEDLAADLRRFLSGETIQARPVGSPERTSRWCLSQQGGGRIVGRGRSLAAWLPPSCRSSSGSVPTGHARRRSNEERGETKAKRKAVQARRDVQQQLIDLSTESGLTAAREGDHALALALVCPDGTALRRLPRARGAESDSVRQLAPACVDPGGDLDAVPGFRQDQDRFRQFRFSPDGNYLLAIASVGDCLLWDRPNGRLVPLTGPAAQGSAAAWEPKSGLLAVGGKDGKVRLLAPPAFEPRDELPAEGDVAVLAFSRDGRYLAWGGAKRRQDLGPTKEAILHTAPSARRARGDSRVQRGRGVPGHVGTRHESQSISRRL